MNFFPVLVEKGFQLFSVRLVNQFFHSLSAKNGETLGIRNPAQKNRRGALQQIGEIIAALFNDVTLDPTTRVYEQIIRHDLR